MTKNELLPALLIIARDVTGEDDLDFNRDTLFEKIEEWDSMNHVHMVVRMEKEFGVHFEDAVRLQSAVKVGDLLDYIADLKGL